MKAECKFVVGSLTFTLAIYLVYASGIVNFINDLPHLQALIRQSGIFGYSLYILLFVIATLMLLPVVSGHCRGHYFGPLWGTLLSLVAATLASSISF